jgi:hydroxyquinol 1,2-dioxygenase
MRDLDEFTVTDEALSQMARTENPRFKEIGDAAVRHLHAFAREVGLTPEEWLLGIQFLTEVGRACTPLRQEFILLSDVLGLSAVVNALHDKKARELGSQRRCPRPAGRRPDRREADRTRDRGLRLRHQQ